MLYWVTDARGWEALAGSELHMSLDVHWLVAINEEKQDGACIFGSPPESFAKAVH